MVRRSMVLKRYNRSAESRGYKVKKEYKKAGGYPPAFNL